MEEAREMELVEETPAPSSPEGVVVDLAEITTRRIRLSDVDDLIKLVLDDEVYHFRTYDTHPTREQASDYLRNEAIPDPWYKAICIQDRAIGTISVKKSPGVYDKCRAELSWFCLSKEYWSKGIMTRVLKTLIPTIFQESPDVERLQAKVDVNNMASRRVLEKVKFHRECVLSKYEIIKGRTVDVAMFSFLSSELRKMTEETPAPSSPEGVVVDLAGITTRRIRLSDADVLWKLAVDNEVNRFRTYGTRSSRDAAIKFLKDEAIPDPFYKVICLDDIAIGAIVLKQKPSVKCRAELTIFCLARKYWNKGIMTKALEMLIPTIFQESPDLERLEAAVEVNNMASQRVLENVRFKREGILSKYRIFKRRAVDVVLFSFLSSDLHVGLSLV